MKKDPQKGMQTSFGTVGLGVLILNGMLVLAFLGGMIFPETAWGVSFNDYLESPWKWIVLGVGLFFFSVPYWNQKRLGFLGTETQFPQNPRALLVSLGLTLFVSIPFLFFQMPFDPFGDAATYGKAFENELNEVDHLEYFLSLNVFHFKSGERTILNLAALLINAFDLSYQEAFLLIGRISGLLYVFIVIRTAVRYLNSWQSVALVCSLVIAPSMFIFMGHIEIYAPLFPALAGFFALSLRYLERPGWPLYLLLVFIWFVCIKFHLSSLLLGPALAMLPILALREKDKGKLTMNWKKMSIWVMLPLLIGFLVLYFGILGDYNDTRDPRIESSSFDRIFLPITNPDPPLDRYSLFDIFHLTDFASLLMVWSPLGLLLLLVAVFPFRRSIKWNTGPVMVFGLCLILYTGFFFMINPLLGMPLDVDLMCIPAPILAFFVIALLAKCEKKEAWNWALGPAVGTVVMALPFIFVHTNESALHNRLIDLGKHSYRTYWVGSAGPIMQGFQSKLDTPKVFEKEFSEVLENLKPFAVEGKDTEYAVLVKNFAAYYRLSLGDLRKAEEYHLLAYRYDPALNSNLLGLAEIYTRFGNFKKALPYCRKLVEVGYPDPQQALTFGLEIALRAGDLDLGLVWARQLSQLLPNDGALKTLIYRLETRTELDKILEGFRPR